MSKQLLIEIYTPPTYIDERNSKIWLNKDGELHRKYGLPAKINDVNLTNSDAEYYINGKKIKVECYLLLEEQIKQIFNEINFEKIHTAMKALNWTWFSSDGVPTIEELKKCAKRSLINAFEKGQKNNSDYNVGTGGFMATYYKEWNMLELKFILSEWSVC